MLTAKRAFNFMMDNGEVDNSQLMDVSRFSPTAQGPAGLLAQIGFPNSGGQHGAGGMPVSFPGISTEAPRQASASDGRSGTLGQDVLSPSEGGEQERTSTRGPQGSSTEKGKDFSTLERRRQREREGMSSLDDDSPMRKAFAVPDQDSDEVRGRDYRFLTENERTAIRERLKGTDFEGMDLESIKVHEGRVPWYLPSDKGAVTLENRIMIGKDKFDPEGDPADFKTLLEEVIHAGQYQSGMTRAGYLWDAARQGGYRKSAYENEAWDIIDSSENPPQ